MKHLIILNEKGESILKTEYTKELESALQPYLANKQKEVQDGIN